MSYFLGVCDAAGITIINKDISSPNLKIQSMPVNLFIFAIFSFSLTFTAAPAIEHDQYDDNHDEQNTTNTLYFMPPSIKLKIRDRRR